MRRVVLVIGQLQQGGAEGQLVRLALGLRAAGEEPSVACLSEVAEPHASFLRDRGVPVAVFPRRTHRDLSRVRALASHIGERRADIVHSFLVGANAYAYAASRLAGLDRLVVSSRTSMPAASRAARWIHSWVFRHASAVIANSEAVASFTASHYGVAREKVRVVRNGVDVEAAAKAAGAGPAVREALGIGPGEIVVGTLGRLSREKNLGLFLAAAARLASPFPRARFVIVGEGPERASLETAVRGLGLGAVVVLAGARSDVAETLAAFDLFVMTSDTEGLPNAVMEAMMAGLPVVATEVGGTAEVLKSGQTGRLVPAGDLEAVLAAAREYLLDPDLRRRHGEAGRAFIAAEFGVERMVAGTRAVYDEVEGSGRREAA